MVRPVVYVQQRYVVFESVQAEQWTRSEEETVDVAWLESGAHVSRGCINLT